MRKFLRIKKGLNIACNVIKIRVVQGLDTQKRLQIFKWQHVESNFNGCCSIEFTISGKVTRIFGIQTNISYCLVNNSIEFI